MGSDQGDQSGVGRLAAINRYPVKSLQGEHLDVVAVGDHGLDGDRAWGIVDRESGQLLTAKRIGTLLEAGAFTGERGPVVTLPDGTVLDGTGPATDDALSRWLDRPVMLVGSNGQAHSFEMSFNVEDEDADRFVWSTPATSFCDLAPLHLLTTAALAAAAEANPSASWSPHRFRPSLVIDTGEDVGFVENEWVGARLAIGDLVVEVTMPTIRCSLPTKAQSRFGLDRDLDVFRTVAAHNHQNLGAYANVVHPATVRVGDPVTIHA